MIDTHCHLDAVDNSENALTAAKEAGISGIIAVGEDLESNRKILDIASNTNPIKIYPALGIHPGKITQQGLDMVLDQIKNNIDKVTAIGEIGLDFWIKEAKKDQAQKNLQIKGFREQIKLANEHDLAVSIHTRGAWKEALDVAVDESLRKGIFHWYTGPIDVLKKLLTQGYYISASPAIEYSQPLIDAVKAAPIEQILIETDCPVTYKPETGRYKSTPKDLIRTVRALAGLKGIAVEKLINIVDSTAKKLFKI